jgi:hypothetical protein
MVTTRLREDQLEYLDELSNERNGSGRSAVLRDIINFHRGVVTSGMVEDHFITLLESKGFIVMHPEVPAEEELTAAKDMLEENGYEVKPP